MDIIREYDKLEKLVEDASKISLEQLTTQEDVMWKYFLTCVDMNTIAKEIIAFAKANNFDDIQGLKDAYFKGNPSVVFLNKIKLPVSRPVLHTAWLNTVGKTYVNKDAILSAFARNIINQ